MKPSLEVVSKLIEQALRDKRGARENLWRVFNCAIKAQIKVSPVGKVNPADFNELMFGRPAGPKPGPKTGK
jgi:hypothetical protein